MQKLTLIEGVYDPPPADSNITMKGLLEEDDIPYNEVEALLEDHLRNELADFEMDNTTSIAGKDVSVKYLFSSALQKSLRRGYAVDALKYGLSYLQLDPVGFWVRLPIIALEDVGLGNSVGVALCLAAARSKIFRSKIGGEAKVAGYIIKVLAEGIKDRSVSDMMQIHWHRPLKYKEQNTIIKATTSELADIALNENLPSFYRTSAAWLLAGTDKYENKYLPPRSGSREQFCAMVSQMRIPSLIKYVAMRGMTACRYPMPIVYPFMWQRLQKSLYCKIEKISFPKERFYIGDLPEEAYCKFTRAGKSAYAYFVKVCEPVYCWLTDKGIVERNARIAAIGIAIFISESARLDRWLDFEGVSDIYEAVEFYDYQNAGLSLSDGRTLAGLIRKNAEVLRQARQSVVEGKRRAKP